MSRCALDADDEGLAVAKPSAPADTLEARAALGGPRDDVFAAAAVAASGRYRLTDRERQVLERLLRGSTRLEIAEELAVTRATVKWHLHHVYLKLGVETGEQALRKALFLEDPRWLRMPMENREALDRMVLAAEEVVRVGKGDRRTRLDGPLARLEAAIGTVRQRGSATPAPTRSVGDDQLVLPILALQEHEPAQ